MLPDGVTLWFIRHGETDWNREQRYQGQTDVPINDTGRAQAARNGRVLREILGAQVESLPFIASPLKRTTETMQIVRRELGLSAEPFERDDRLKEQHFGHWEGLLYRDLPRLDPEGFAARHADMWGWCPRGGESYEMVRARILPWLAGITRDTIVVSHGNVGRTVRGILLGLDETAVPRLEARQDLVLRLRRGEAEWV
jgi:probable phosphoglycerate mutase